jgi:8-oxo-dGTP pyrophosphatase MutT (NUDIX family)
MLGHVTASLLVVSPDGGSVLLIDHKGLGKKLPPGGHLDPGEMPLEAALREAAEETGIDLSGLSLMEGFEGADGLVDIDSHPIPANPRKGEGPHRHHDFCFVRRAASLALSEVFDKGVAGRDWVPVAQWIEQGDPRAKVLARAVGLVEKFDGANSSIIMSRTAPKL